jgi:hypothetical protein
VSPNNAMTDLHALRLARYAIWLGTVNMSLIQSNALVAIVVLPLKSNRLATNEKLPLTVNQRSQCTSDNNSLISFSQCVNADAVSADVTLRLDDRRYTVTAEATLAGEDAESVCDLQIALLLRPSNCIIVC